MNIDILTAQLVRKGFSQERAKVFANEILTIARDYGINPSNLIDHVSEDFKLNDLGSFIVNNALRFGYVTGKMQTREPNKYVARAIIK
jgi:hypothetical protein